MSTIIISIVMGALRLLFDDVILKNHPIMKAIMEPQPLKPDPNPSPKDRQGPIEPHYGD